MAERGQGPPPARYAFAWVRFCRPRREPAGQGPGERPVFAEGDPDGPEDRWFEALSVHIADILHEVGVPYCAGGVMAKNPLWRGSLSTWRARVAHWISRSNPQDLLSVDIFFDLRGVHGDTSLAETLWRETFAAAHNEAAFAKLLADTAGSVEPAIGMFGTIRTEQGRLDLKKAGLFGIVTAARVLAIRHHVVERATPARLKGVRALDLGGERDLEAPAAPTKQEVLLTEIRDILAKKPA